MTRVTRSEVQAALEGRSIEVARAQADPRLAGVPLAQTDRDGDGAIRGADEIDRVFALVDRVDRDGHRSSIATRTRSGAVTEAGAQLGALGEHAGAGELAGAGIAGRDGRPTDGVLFVGMGRGSGYEASALRERGARVKLLAAGRQDDSVQLEGRRFELGTVRDVRAFARTLRLPPDQTESVTRAIASNPPRGRDELARIAQVWARAERGYAVPSRLVLSGHSGGATVYGDGGQVSFAALGRLAAAMPRGARSIEDLHVSACNAGRPQHVDHWRATFPRLRSFWGYVGSAPGSFTGATRHLGGWERDTRGRREDLTPESAVGTRKGANVATWSAQEAHSRGERP